jgi:serine/threonine-protein kinase
MTRCAACSGEIPQDSRFCPACGAAVDSASFTPTMLTLDDDESTSDVPPTPAPGSQRAGSPRFPTARSAAPRASRANPYQTSDPIDEGRFPPGTMLAGRYRIAGLLGRGGMGEVYRADDLTLGQPVALKFLPGSLEQSDLRLARFLNEVKIARQVSHANVCRVYDVGEVERHFFISMEYVRGEDLASLLRQIGRLPSDKAVEISRQLCAGLAAAHDLGILHRDLKPANVMIDERGRVRVMDFGLATLASDVAGSEVRSGTPAYMSPEQLDGRDVSTKSDLYGLGLVLYELFTGRQAFQASTTTELVRMHRESTPTSPSAYVEGIDPAVERVILRCLDKDPALRPKSALAVAAALPGGDPLAAALAAGETPSPELVAEAVRHEALAPPVAWACMAFTLIGLGLMAFLQGNFSLLGPVPLHRAPQSLADQAREVVELTGRPAGGGYQAYRFVRDDEYLEHLKDSDPSANRWNRLATDRPTAIRFWYRSSPVPLVPGDPAGELSFLDPPLNRAGMVNVILDTEGRLEYLLAVPSRQEPGVPEAAELADEAAAAPSWSPLFTQAGLDPARFSPTTPARVPETYCDERVAWTGSYDQELDSEVRVEGCAYRGNPVYFETIASWRDPAAVVEPASKIEGIFNVLVLIGAYIVARRNVLARRGDRKGAFRLGVYVFCVQLIASLLLTQHIPSVVDPWRLVAKVGHALYVAFFIWLMYLALEPFVRRQWPESIVSWTRVLSGRFRDPLVARHLLFGATVGAALALVSALEQLVPGWLDPALCLPLATNTGTLHDARWVVAQFFSVLAEFVQAPMVFLLILALFRFLLRKQWLAVGLFILIFSAGFSLDSEYFYVGLISRVLKGSLVAFATVRFGLVAGLSAFFISVLPIKFPLTMDFTTWYANSSLLALLAAAGLAIYAFWVSQSGQRLMRQAALRE